LRLTYRHPVGAATDRTVQPLGLFFWGKVWTLVAWCELRSDFRSFRLDRMQTVVAGGTFSPEPGRTLEEFFRYVAAHAGERNQRRL
jgi:predicted DNA-binding transcriptional regulator YafY